MTDLPNMKIKALVSFPSNVYGGTGIEVVKANGNFTVDLDYSEFVKASALPPNTYTLVWDPISNSYALVPPTATGGISDAPNNGIMFGRKNAAWTDAWASPALTGTATAPTPAPGGSDGRIATTAFVAAAVLAGSGGSPSNTVPGMNGVGAAGVSALYSRGDHIHPTDTSRQAADADLAAVAALSGTGIARRTAPDTWSVGTAVTNAELAQMPMFTLKGNSSVGTAAPSDITIASLTAKASPAGGDFLLLSDQAASGALKKIAISALPGSSGGISEAPNDGQLYGRQSLGWSVVVGGGATPSGALPAMDSVANAGTSLLYSRGDHVHPSDTTKADKTYVDSQDATKANLASPTFTGNPTAPTPAPGTNTIAIATTAFVNAALVAGGSVTPAALTKVDETNITLTLGGSPGNALLQATSITVGWTGTLAPGRGGFGVDVSAANGVPLFTSGVPTFTATTGTGNLVRAADPVLTGNPIAPTQSAGHNDGTIATTAFVTSAVATGIAAVPVDYVRYGAAQVLTSAQRSQARSNIDVTKKNYIINGAMMVSQENGTADGTSNAYFCVDQFQMIFSSSTGTMHSAQSAFVTPAGSPMRYHFAANPVNTSLGSGEYAFVRTTLEGLRVADLRFGSASAKTVTLQFGVKAPTGTYCICIRNGGLTRAYIAEYVIAAGETNTDVIKSVTIPGDVDVTGTWAKDNNVGLYVDWILAAGTTLKTATLGWQAAGFVASNNQFNCIAVTTGFELFDVSLTEGTTAPPFQVPDYGSELLASQRYFYYSPPSAQVVSQTNIFLNFKFAVTMRATPAITPAFGGGTGATFVIDTTGMYQNSNHSAPSNFSYKANARP